MNAKQREPLLILFIVVLTQEDTRSLVQTHIWNLDINLIITYMIKREKM